jgi:hypothetical protein
MIIARGSSGSHDEVLILGLSRENIRRLQEGEPIRIRRATHGDGIPARWQIVIIFGETEQSMRREFEEHGMIGPETKIHINPRLKK